MLKKTITYQDLDGNDVTEDFYFNLSKAEIAEMELSHEGGFSTYLQRLVDSKDGAEIIGTFKSIITKAIGRRSEDGRRFVKSEEIIQDFLQSDAYSVMFMELVTNGDAAAEFVNGVVPSDLVDEMKKQTTSLPVEDLNAAELQEPKDERPAYIRENRDPNPKELQEMSKEELQVAFEWKLKRNQQ